MTSKQAIVASVRCHWKLIKKAAALHDLDPSLLAALVAQESQGDTWAERLEPGYRWIWGDDPSERPIKKPPLMSESHWLKAQEWSRGLCQVMVATACEHGFSDWPARLHDPWIGLTWGAMYLKKCINKEQGSIRRGLRRYNGSEDYPPLVLEWEKEFKND
jgi:hypothetical protein